MDRNCVLVTVVVVGKDKNADNPDIKRPVLDVVLPIKDPPELKKEGKLPFTQVMAVFPGGALARSAIRYKIGDVIVLCGEIRGNRGHRVFLEVQKAASIQRENCRSNNEKIRSLLGKTELLRLTGPNFVSLSGTVETIMEDGFLMCSRRSPTQGDLSEKNIIPIRSSFTNLPELKVGSKIVCTGILSDNCVEAETIFVTKE